MRWLWWLKERQQPRHVPHTHRTEESARTLNAMGMGTGTHNLFMAIYVQHFFPFQKLLNCDLLFIRFDSTREMDRDSASNSDYAWSQFRVLFICRFIISEQFVYVICTAAGIGEPRWNYLEFPFISGNEMAYKWWHQLVDIHIILDALIT